MIAEERNRTWFYGCVIFNSPNPANPHVEYVDDELIFRKASSYCLVYLTSHKYPMHLLLGLWPQSILRHLFFLWL